MSQSATAAGFKDFMRRHQGQGAVAESAEAQLDGMLQLRQSRDKADVAGKGAGPDHFEEFRRRMVEEFVPVLEELSAKYETQGIIFSWNLGQLMQGGRQFTLELTFGGHRLTVRGAVGRDVVGFEEVRSRGPGPGEMTSGLMLRIKTLTAPMMRDFICGHMLSLVRTVMRQERSNS